MLTKKIMASGRNMTKMNINSASERLFAFTWACAIALIVTPLLAGCGNDSASGTAPADTASASSTIPPKPPPVAANPAPVAAAKPVYTLESSDDCTVDQDQPCRRISIVVPKGQSKAQIAADLTHAAQEAAASYGTVRGIVFARAEGTDKNGVYTAGRALFGSNEDTDRLYTPDAPAIDYVEAYFKPEASAPASTSRISETKRKRIYFESALAGDKAQHEADVAYPTDKMDNAEQQDQSQRNFAPNMTLERKLSDENDVTVKKHHHLTEDQYDAIQQEGAEKSWPTPDETKDQ